MSRFHRVQLGPQSLANNDNTPAAALQSWSEGETGVFRVCDRAVFSGSFAPALQLAPNACSMAEDARTCISGHRQDTLRAASFSVAGCCSDLAHLNYVEKSQGDEICLGFDVN